MHPRERPSAPRGIGRHGERSLATPDDRKIVGADIQVVEYEWPKISARGLVKGLGAGLWEVRSALQSHRIARVLFGVAEGRMVILHGFIKKTQKTPAADLRLAKDRWRDWKKVSST